MRLFILINLDGKNLKKRGNTVLINEMFFLLVTLVYLALVVVAYKLFGKNGMYIYSVFSTIICNIGVCRMTDIFGLSTSAGTIFYAANYLATDILSENHGKKEAQKAVWYSFFTMMVWILATQCVVFLKPSASDHMSSSLNKILGFSPFIFISSAAAFLLSQTFDVFMYHFLWEKTGNNKTMLWLRNNVATCLSQAIDTVAMSAGLVLFGIYSLKAAIAFTLGKYVIKVIIALLDTPFAYLARMLKNKGEKVSSESSCSENKEFVPAV